jgi:hypothetical protein
MVETGRLWPVEGRTKPAALESEGRTPFTFSGSVTKDMKSQASPKPEIRYALD